MAVDQDALKIELGRIRYSFYGFAFFVTLGLLGEVFTGQLGFRFFFWVPVVLLSLKSFYQVLFNFQYSFWSFAFGLFTYILLSMLGSEGSFIINCYSIALILLIFLCFMTSSPIFYPRITWWEYDFRFRGELKIEAHIGEKTVQGRLTDLRREAGCVVLFERLKLGQEFTINYQDGEDSESNLYPVKAISRRSSTLGRGYTYGVKFLFLKEKERYRFMALSNLWKVTKKAKRLAKFQNAS